MNQTLYAEPIPSKRMPCHPHAHGAGGRTPLRRGYLAVLAWAFTLFSSARLAAYLPTLWAIHQSGDASQHSLLTWSAWLGSNVTMAAWLYEQNSQRVDRAVAVSAGNATMCLAAVALIAWYRLS